MLRLEAKRESGDRRLESEIEDIRESIGSRLDGVERTQSGQEGVISVLVQRRGAGARRVERFPKTEGS